jgi:hypothetical protein
MSFDWKEFFNLALVLQGLYPQNFAQEAALRSSVSRSYYGAYKYALNYATSNLGYMPHRGKQASRNHSALRSHYRDQRMTRVALNLDLLHQWRKQCDYDDTVANLSIMVRNSLGKTREVINQLP